MLYALMGHRPVASSPGVLNIPNFAHGALFAVGAYLLVHGHPARSGISGWRSLLAPLGVALLGVLIEYAGIRRLYAAGHDYQLLLTFGLSLIITEGIIIDLGPGRHEPAPAAASCAAASTSASPSTRSTASS